MSLAILFHFLCAQHVSDINISIIRSLRHHLQVTSSWSFILQLLLDESLDTILQRCHCCYHLHSCHCTYHFSEDEWGIIGGGTEVGYIKMTCASVLS